MASLVRLFRSPDSSPTIAGPSPDAPKAKVMHTGGGHIAEAWLRPPNKSPGGATHVRTFTSKMTASSIEHLDKHINEWLGQHPEADVKFTTLQVGDMSTSLGKEQVLVVQVWV